MKTALQIVMVVTAVLVVMGAADAATLATPAVYLHEENAQCSVANISSSDRSIEIKLMNENGGVVDQTDGLVTVLAGHVNGNVGATIAIGFVYCKFKTGSPGAFRASMAVYGTGSSDRLSVPAK